MTRERKEIFKKMDELGRMEQAEYEMSCGFCTEQIEKAFAPSRQRLQEKLAATYGMTVDAYDGREYEIGIMLQNKGIFAY